MWKAQNKSWNNRLNYYVIYSYTDKTLILYLIYERLEFNLNTQYYSSINENRIYVYVSMYSMQFSSFGYTGLSQEWGPNRHNHCKGWRQHFQSFWRLSVFPLGKPRVFPWCTTLSSLTVVRKAKLDDHCDMTFHPQRSYNTWRYFLLLSLI